MSVAAVTVLFFGVLIIFLILGLPIAFSLGGVAMLFSLLMWGPASLYQVASAVWGTGNDWLFVCIPLFIFMGTVLQFSGVADDLYTMMHRWMGPIKGGLAMGTILMSTIFAAMAGISGGACVTLGLIALPAMLKRGYHKNIALGSIAAGAALGILIPPSLMMILYGAITGVSIGKLFAGGILPGILLSVLFLIYIGIRCIINPRIGPTLPLEERSSWKMKLISLKAVLLPLLIILAVLGSIYTGAATPTEAAGVGALGALVSSVIYRRLNWQRLREASLSALKLSALIMWIVIGATCYRSVYSAIGGPEFVQEALMALPVGRYTILIGIQVIIFFLGMFVDPAGIVMIATPIFMPVVQELGFNPLWFGILFCMNLEMAYLTPPLGLNLFYLKGVAPPEIGLSDIYRSVVPFVIIQAIGLALIILFPQIALWLPSLMGR